MTEKKLYKNPIRIYESTYRLLDQEKLSIRIAGNAEPSYAEQIEAYIRLAKSVDAVEPEYSYVEANRLWHDKLEAILNSGDEATISAVTQNIMVFFDRLRPCTRCAPRRWEVRSKWGISEYSR